MEFKEKVEAFKASCRVYKQERARIIELRKKRSDPITFQLLRYTEADTKFVEEKLDEIETICGPNARVMVWYLYVEGRTQQEVADEFKITRRQLQYSLNKWMEKVFIENNDDDGDEVEETNSSDEEEK